MNPARQRAALLALNNVPLALFALALLAFGALAPSFLSPANLLNLLVQASATAIVATGATFVLLTAGVDLSVGAIMFVAAALSGKLLLAQGWSPPWVLAGMVLLSGHLSDKLRTLTTGATNCALPVVNTYADVGFGAVVGHDPQDYAFKGEHGITRIEPSTDRLRIGRSFRTLSEDPIFRPVMISLPSSSIIFCVWNERSSVHTLSRSVPENETIPIRKEASTTIV